MSNPKYFPMTKKPTYKELEQKLKALEKENALFKNAVDDLKEAGEKFKTIVENANDEIIYISKEGTVIEINNKCEDLFGLTRKEVIGKNFAEFEYFGPEHMQDAVDFFNDVMRGKQAKLTELKAMRKDGTTVFIEVNPRLIEKNGEILGVLTIIRDITERKKVEAELENYRDHLEELVKERTATVEEANTALRVMLNKAHEFKKELEDAISFNMKRFVFPYLEKLRKGKMNETQRDYLGNLEINLNDITSPYMKGISTKYLKLTPTEIQVANLVRHGRTTKEIAEILCMSTRTIDAHRYNIRTKVGLTNKKKNLRTYLLSLK